MRWLEHRIPPPIVALVVGVAMWGVAHAGPSWRIDATLRIAAALALIALGVGIAATGARGFRRAGTTTNPLKPETANALVVDGIYRYTRNPMYLGVTIALAGWAVYLTAPLAWLGPVVFAAYVTRFQIFPEERALATKFGAPYLDYMRRVRRWL